MPQQAYTVKPPSSAQPRNLELNRARSYIFTQNDLPEGVGRAKNKNGGTG